MELDHDYLKYYKIENKAILVDLGATNGEFIYINKEAILQTDAFVVNVEPVAEQYSRMADWINKNMPNNAIVLSTGVWKENTCLTLNVTDNVWCNMFEIHGHDVSSFTSKVRSSAAPVITLDTVIEIAGGKIDFLKADIEGAELEVFENCNNLNKIANFAIASYHIRDDVKTYIRLEKFFTSKGYNVIHENIPYNGFPAYDMLYCSKKK
jgi:FkbM family methyltransferase